MDQPIDAVWASKEPCILGIDEAGRGPVLGPMVYAATYCPKSCEPALNALGADDSKQLSEQQRENLRHKIDSAPFLRSVSRVLSAHELSVKMLRKVKHNLNLISHETALSLVRQAMDEGANISEIYVDTVGNPDIYAQKFRDAFPNLKKIVVAKKADSTYRIVGAASIVAKTTRDRAIRDWVFPEEQRSANYGPSEPNAPVMYPEEKGSGYPGDPLTKKWMDESCDRIFGFPTFVRFSWSTTKTLLEKKSVEVDWCVVPFAHRATVDFSLLNRILFSSYTSFAYSNFGFLSFNLFGLSAGRVMTMKRMKCQLSGPK